MKYDWGNPNIFTETSRSVITPGNSRVQRDMALIQASNLAREKARKVVARERRVYKSPSKAYEVVGTFYARGQCVPFAWTQGMKTRGYGAARNYPVQQTPTRFVSTYEGYRGHIAVVVEDLGDKLVIMDAGYRYGLITKRVISKRLVKGYVR